MTRAELLKSPDYWKSRIQIALYNCAESFMRKNRKNRKQLAEYLGVSCGYVTQLLNGDYDHKLSKLAELSLAFGYIPILEFVPADQYIVSEQGFELNRRLKAAEYHLSDEKFRVETKLCGTLSWEETKYQKGAA